MIAAIYARKSTEQNGVADEQKSVTRQVEHARTYAVRKGWTVDEAAVFVDDGISGAEFAARPGFLRLMIALKPRAPFQVLLMSEESRLGREAIETAYALKQIIRSGVRVFFCLENRERTLDSPTDKIMLSLTAFADELEREKARQRTYDAMLRKARAGHVTGGRVFGYDQVEVLGSDGRRSHVARQPNERQAAIVRRIFDLSAGGAGVKAIAKQLNANGAESPRAQCGRSQTWAPTSVREVLNRNLYRGIITWNRTRKRDADGRKHPASRPAADWIDVPAPALRIVSDEQWKAAHRRQATARAVYMKGTGGRAFGRPANGTPSKYLLTGLSQCGECGQGLVVKSRSHGHQRAYFYACGSYHQRGSAVCSNYTEIPMGDGNEIVIEALLDDVLDESIVRDAVDEAIELLQGAGESDRLDRLERELAKVERERSRYVAAIGAGGELPGLLEVLREREARRASLEADRAAVRSQCRLRASDAGRVRGELIALASSWRRVLAHDPTQARPIVSSLLQGRATFTPGSQRGWWEVRGRGSIAGLFTRVFASGGSSPTGSHLGAVAGSVLCAA